MSIYWVNTRERLTVPTTWTSKIVFFSFVSFARFDGWASVYNFISRIQPTSQCDQMIFNFIYLWIKKNIFKCHKTCSGKRARLTYANDIEWAFDGRNVVLISPKNKKNWKRKFSIKILPRIPFLRPLEFGMML